MWETWIRSLGQEDPLEKEMATHSSIHAWKIPWTEQPGGLQSMESQRVGRDWATSAQLSSAGLMTTTRLKWLFSRSVVSNFLQSHGPQHYRPPCPSPSPGACSNSYEQWCSVMSVILLNHLILCHPLLLLPPIFPSIRVFSNESALLIRWAKYWSFGISPSNEHWGLISFMGVNAKIF